MVHLKITEAMIDHSAANASQSLEPPQPYTGATPEAERAKKPVLPEPPYKPYDGM